MLETMITLALVGMLMLVGYLMLRDPSMSLLREDSMEIGAVLRAARNMVIETGEHHRVVFDFEEQSYRIEACPGVTKLVRSDEEQVINGEDLEELQEKYSGDNLPEVLSADSPEAALEAAAALEGVRIGTARCALSKLENGDADGRGNLRTVRKDKGIEIRRIYVQHIEDSVKEGIVSINFFPLGYAEKAIVEIVNRNGDQFTLLVHGMTGFVEIRNGELDNPDDHMRRNALGDSEDER